MIKKEQIIELTEKCLSATDRFITKVSVGKDNLINVYIDGDSGVTIDHCVELSRFIEKNLDREIEDYELKVSSAGADQVFVNYRQYVKNIGKPVEIILLDGTKKQGVLSSVSPELLKMNESQKKSNKKNNKIIAGEIVEIPMQSIKQAKVLIVF